MIPIPMLVWKLQRFGSVRPALLPSKGMVRGGNASQIRIYCSEEYHSVLNCTVLLGGNKAFAAFLRTIFSQIGCASIYCNRPMCVHAKHFTQSVAHLCIFNFFWYFHGIC